MDRTQLVITMRKPEASIAAKREPRVLSSPPPPHDPLDRMLVGHIDEWELRIFDPSGRWHEYFAPRGLLHLQLWNEEYGISLISPSQLTLHRYELHHPACWKFAHRELCEIESKLAEYCGLRLPHEEQLISLEYGWVDTVAAEAKSIARSKTIKLKKGTT